jgi:hypothetical protein
MPILWSLAGPKLDEREVLAAMLEVDVQLVRERPGLLLITDKGFASRAFERSLVEQDITLLRPSMKRGAARPGEPMLEKVRRLTESVNDTLKSRLDIGYRPVQRPRPPRTNPRKQRVTAGHVVPRSATVRA